MSGPEWKSNVNRQYIVQDYLLAFSDAFDAAMDRLMLADPYVLAEDMCTLLEWQGGVRAFETALRFGKDHSVFEHGTGVELLEGKEDGPVERRPLQPWGRLLEMSNEARAAGAPFNRDLADKEKQRVSSSVRDTLLCQADSHAALCRAMSISRVGNTRRRSCASRQQRLSAQPSRHTCRTRLQPA